MTVGGDPFARLSPREAEVARLTRASLPNKQIAGMLGVSDDTVRAHLESIASKWRVDPALERRTAIVNVVRDWEVGIPLPETGMVVRSAHSYLRNR